MWWAVQVAELDAVDLMGRKVFVKYDGEGKAAAAPQPGAPGRKPNNQQVTTLRRCAAALHSRHRAFHSPLLSASLSPAAGTALFLAAHLLLVV